jgi:hypothetical protein
MDKTIVVIRDLKDHRQSLGSFYVLDGCDVVFKSESIERGWVNNENMVSCFPEGTYEIVLEYSSRFKKSLWEIKAIKGRSECKIHAANFARQLNGCIALGKNRADIDKDGFMDVTSSGDTMKLFHKAMGNQTKSTIKVINLENVS